MRRPLATLLAAACPLLAHAPILQPIVGPLEVRGNTLYDIGARGPTQLSGVATGLDPAPLAFGVIRVRWNMNHVRVPVSISRWRQTPEGYLQAIESTVRSANQANLLAILAATETTSNGLPPADADAFWSAVALRLKDHPRVVFSLFHEPAAAAIPPGDRWPFWRDGGTDGGVRVPGMQALIDAIRNTGANQVIAVPAFHDSQGFQGLDLTGLPRGANLIYEAHPSFAFGTTTAAIERLFGVISTRAPVYAGSWGLGDCTGIPRDSRQAANLLFDALEFFDRRSMSWAAATFAPGGLVADFADFEPSTVTTEVTCSGNSGMGDLILYWTTGDPSGFGYLKLNAILNSAGGLPGPAAPGLLLSLYPERLGPENGVRASLTSEGRLPLSLEGTEVRFDGVPAPILYTNAYQINVQVPYEVKPGSKTVIQAFYNGVPSNRLSVEVAEAAPGIFHDLSTRYAVALNQDGALNGPTRPARSGSIVVLFASGGGQTSPPGVTGLPAPSPHPQLAASPTLTVEGQRAEVLFAGEVPGNVGLLQVNATLPQLGGGTRPVPLVLTIGGRATTAPVLLWIAP